MAEKKTTKPAAEEAAKKPAAKKATEEKPAAKKPAAEKAEPKKAAEKKPAEKKPAAKKEAAPKAKKEEVKPAAQEVEEIDDEVIELISEDGESKKFYHVATIDYENEWYVFFQPAEKMEDTDEDEVVVFHLDSDENDNDIFLPVQSEELLHKVYAEYVRLMEEHEGCGHDHDHEHGGCAPSACAGCHNKCK